MSIPLMTRRAAILATMTLAGTALAQEPLETVVVTATRAERALLEVPASVTAQDMNQLREQGFTHGTDEFRGVPGVYFRRGEGDGDEFPFVTIRGVTGNHGNDTFLALVDGIPFVGPDEEVLLYEVPYAAVERVEIVRGPVSALYGRGAIAGAVNYLTRDPEGSGTRFSLSAGEDDYYRGEAIVERSTEKAGFLGSVAYENTEGWREHSARETLNLFAKGRIEIGDRAQLTGYLNYIDRDGEVPGAIPTLADGTLVDVAGGREGFLGFGDTHNTFDGVLAALRLEQKVSDDLDYTLTVHARRFDHANRLNFYDSFGFNPESSIMAVNGFGSESSSDVLFFEGSVHWRAGRHDIVAGLSAERTTQEEREFWSGQYGFTFECGFAFFLIEIDFTTGQPLNADHPCFVNDQLQADADTTNRFWSAFIQDEIALTDSLSLTVGGRYDAFERDVSFGPTGPFNPVARPMEIPVRSLQRARSRGATGRASSTPPTAAASTPTSAPCGNGIPRSTRARRSRRPSTVSSSAGKGARSTTG